MRNFLTITSGLFLLVTACTDGPAELKEPPVLKVTSPQRSLVKDGAGMIDVAGTVTPNEKTNVPVEKVLVNDVQATLSPDGSFHAQVQIREGAQFIKTVARDADGGVATDTRAVQAGQLRQAGANIDNALSASISTQSFEKISAAAGTAIMGMDLGAMIKPMQPMVDVGGGPDCLYAQGFIENVHASNIQINLVPVSGGLSFRAQIDGLDVPGHANFAVACVDGSNSFRVQAQRIVVGGTLLVSPDGMNGFKTDLVDTNVQLTGFNLSASGIPGTIIDMLHLDSAIQSIIPTVAKFAMKPIMNQALGALAGPKTLDVMGKQMTVQIVPSDISFDPNGGLVTLNTQFLIAGAENAKFIYTDNGMPSMDAGNGFVIGLADDLANELMSEAHSLGLLNLALPAAGGTFDGTAVSMSMPPMIAADPADGTLKVMLGDMMVTFTNHGTPVAKAAMNVKIDLAIESAGNGYAVALKLGKPTIDVNVVDDIANATRLLDHDLEAATSVCLTTQIENISRLLVNIPLPAVAGLQMRNLTVGSDSGYVLVKGTFE
jgi:glucodextranase-like protein